MNNIQTKIERWKQATSAKKEVRTFSIGKSKSIDGEFEVILKMSLKVVDMAQSETASVSIKLTTLNQDIDDETFNRAAKRLENDFQLKCGKVYDRLSNRSNDRNPYN